LVTFEEVQGGGQANNLPGVKRNVLKRAARREDIEKQESPERAVAVTLGGGKKVGGKPDNEGRETTEKLLKSP